MPSVNERQVGGTHYRAAIQHWDLVAGNGLDYFQGVSSKYVTRWRSKGGTQDLEKGIHYLEKKLVVVQEMPPKVDLEAFARANRLTEQEEVVCWLIANSDSNPHRLQEAIVHMRAMIDNAPEDLRRG